VTRRDDVEIVGGRRNEGLAREAEMTETTFDTTHEIDILTAKELKGRYGRSFDKADGTSAHVDYCAGRGRMKIGRGYSVTWFVADDTAEYGCRLLGPVAGDKFKSIASVKVALREWMTGALENTQTAETVIPGDEVKLLGIKGTIVDTSRTHYNGNRIEFEAGGQVAIRILKPATKVTLFVRHGDNDKHGFERACQMDEQKEKDTATDKALAVDDPEKVQNPEGWSDGDVFRNYDVPAAPEVPQFAVGDTVKHTHPEVLNTGTVTAADNENGRIGIEWDDGLRTVCRPHDIRKVADAEAETDTIEELSAMVADRDEKIADLESKLDSLRERYSEKSRTLREVQSHKALVLAVRIAEHVLDYSGVDVDIEIDGDKIYLDGLTDDPSDEETLRDLVRKYHKARS
jgi:uncharacterized coiled-coil protein SlyX